MTSQMDKPRQQVRSEQHSRQGAGHALHPQHTHPAVAAPAMPARRGRQSVRCAIPPQEATQARATESPLGQQRSVCKGAGRARECQAKAQSTQCAAPHELWPLQTSKHRPRDPCATLLPLKEQEGSWRAAVCAPGQPLAHSPQVSRQQRYNFARRSCAHAHAQLQQPPVMCACLRVVTAHADSQGTSISHSAQATMPQAVGRLQQPQPPRKPPPGSLHSP